jgi:hypothetical protein
MNHTAPTGGIEAIMKMLANMNSGNAPGKITFHVWNELPDGTKVDTTPIANEGLIKVLNDIHVDAPLEHKEFDKSKQLEVLPVLKQVTELHKQGVVKSGRKWEQFLLEKCATPTPNSCVFNAMAYKRANGGRIVIGKCGWKTRSGGVWWEWE